MCITLLRSFDISESVQLSRLIYRLKVAEPANISHCMHGVFVSTCLVVQTPAVRHTRWQSVVQLWHSRRSRSRRRWCHLGNVAQNVIAMKHPSRRGSVARFYFRFTAVCFTTATLWKYDGNTDISVQCTALCCWSCKAQFRAPDPTQLNSTQLAVELS